ncbi:hypothetical protein FSP39_024942 [Pinctada imbricata]|uniref:Uncharacterized protein n=1 Tax=Pinctada imbricata TaxID=66713 RepID=A0AA88Y6Y4_PINIB|nr:hypothetical protein FSP39_024942 [Pinctada imbricata]
MDRVKGRERKGWEEGEKGAGGRRRVGRGRMGEREKRKKGGRRYVLTIGEPTRRTVGSEVKCSMQRTVQEERYFQKLSSKKNDLRERNKIIYAEFPFYRTTWVLGWTMRGKRGPLRGEDTERPGLITEYVMLYLNNEGKWNFINNTKNGKEVFWNNGNLAQPDTITKVNLATPLQTNMLRLFPQLWDGVPYVRININYCQEPDPTAPASPSTKDKVKSIKSTWVDRKISSNEINAKSSTEGGIRKPSPRNQSPQEGSSITNQMTSEKMSTERKLEKEKGQRKINNKKAKQSSKPGNTDFAKLFSSGISNSNSIEGTNKNTGSPLYTPTNKGVMANASTDTSTKNDVLYKPSQTAAPKSMDKYIKSKEKTSKSSLLSWPNRKKLRPQNIKIKKQPMTSAKLKAIGFKLEKAAMISNNASLKNYDIKRKYILFSRIQFDF